MKNKTLPILIATSLMMVITINAYAVDAPTSTDEQSAIKNCILQKLKDKTPPIDQTKIDQCGDVTVSTAGKCFDLSDEEYNINYVKFCTSQLITTKCVATKMNVTLNQYTACDQEQDPGACFKRLGYTPNDILKLSEECQIADAK